MIHFSWYLGGDSCLVCASSILVSSCSVRCVASLFYIWGGVRYEAIAYVGACYLLTKFHDGYSTTLSLISHLPLFYHFALNCLVYPLTQHQSPLRNLLNILTMSESKDTHPNPVSHLLGSWRRDLSTRWYEIKVLHSLIVLICSLTGRSRSWCRA